MSTLKSVVALLGFVVSVAAQADTITVLSDRTEFHLKPLIQQFEHQTGHTVKAIFVDEGGLPARLAARPDEADVLVTTDIVGLELAKREGYLKPISITSKIPAQFKDADNYYTALSYRARTLVIPADKMAQFSSYEDLSKGKYRVCMRPLNHAYNINLLSQMIADKGESFARSWITGVKANLAMSPTGNDRKQAEFVAQNKCDVSLMNTYYYGLLQTNKAQRESAGKVTLYFPEQSGSGTYILESGAGLTKTGNATVGNQFIDFMLNPLSQAFIANVNFEYPVMEGIALPQMVQGFAEGQEGVKAGQGKLNVLSIKKIADSRDKAVSIINELK